MLDRQRWRWWQESQNWKSNNNNKWLSLCIIWIITFHSQCHSIRFDLTMQLFNAHVNYIYNDMDTFTLQIIFMWISVYTHSTDSTLCVCNNIETMIKTNEVLYYTKTVRYEHWNSGEHTLNSLCLCVCVCVL